MRVPIINAVLLAGAITAGTAGMTFAQANGPDPHHPEDAPQTTSPSDVEGMTGSPGEMPGSDMMPGGMMGRNMMRSGMGGMPMMGMRGPMMKIMFAIADTDGDGSLSFDEVTAIHKRIFGGVDANKDGKVTIEEMQAFWRP
ncbi:MULTISPECIES: EF-hand domain-containing protein [Rhizobium]|uniref:EF-hand domain-containing protein n=1 Tax=Rhizobium TaxID=379 RepID=UPI0007E947F3|nr:MULTISPECIES: EF-hand domain-containing protein [Rhizobium]ANK89304.1 calcium-binding EF-hand domain-containing protein [Rhizobium sp. N731]ANK94658.1 calcium-binding EF-hand domain-containing protein [Rhizobium sp. N6212]ANL00708.1 calcium-binding EF-hand domain-containing protein [Rhizobium sp. N621]ANL06829.1 calcium-binding EF-hand domain-containing protein [Rhizobium esperanzae]ANL12999.1 calcium-binding EF-hand domain-containing protein [Rhizobium sp. N1341]